jgi:hypothetical protein
MHDVDHVLDGAGQRAEIDHLTAALTNRGLIGQAVGVLVATHRMSPEAAWQALSRTSQETNVKVARLAPVLVEIASGVTPLDTEAARAAERLLPSVETAVAHAWRDRHALAEVRDAVADERDEAADERDRQSDVADRAGAAAGNAADPRAALNRGRAAGDRRAAAADRRAATADLEAEAAGHDPSS